MKQKVILLLIVMSALQWAGVRAAAQSDTQTHLVQPGDTWTALAWRYGLDAAALQAASSHINRQRQPTIGSVLLLPSNGLNRTGKLVRSMSGGLLETAVRYHTSPWTLALQNNQVSPYRPLLYQPIFIPGGTEPARDLPPGFERLELSQTAAHPGQALAYRAQTSQPISVTATLDNLQFDSFGNGRHLVGLIGTGAFYGAGTPELTIQVANAPLWSQPWLFEDSEWTYQQITLTGTAAAIDQESIEQERARLFELWSQASPTPHWTQSFQLPITNYLKISSHFGARRSYNGGPYNRYHEGVDFSAYGGTAVTAPAAATVTLAETLYVRGNAVILNHGLGIYTGYYHLSSIAVEAGQMVQPGQLLGEVGSTGLSTGNHLHWDLLVASAWVDASAWLEQDMACWILAGLGQSYLE